MARHPCRRLLHRFVYAGQTAAYQQPCYEADCNSCAEDHPTAVALCHERITLKLTGLRSARESSHRGALAAQVLELLATEEVSDEALEGGRNSVRTTMEDDQAASLGVVGQSGLETTLPTRPKEAEGEERRSSIVLVLDLKNDRLWVKQRPDL